MNKICVLLAAYNGSLWIVEQIDSILKQTNVDAEIFISVDYSHDETLNICLKYENEYKNIHVLDYGNSYGSAALNFFRLIKDVDTSNFEYIAFSDQDDVWLPEKLSRAVAKLNESGADCYASDLTLWEEGKTRGKLIKSQKIKNFDYIFQGASAGCTYVLNQDSFSYLKKIITIINPSDKKISHDWITYAVTRSKEFKWIIDSCSLILYRQHSSNVQGARKGIHGGLKKIYQIRSGWYFYNILKLRDFLVMSEGERVVLDNILSKSIKSRLMLIFNSFSYRRRFLDAMILIIIFSIY